MRLPPLRKTDLVGEQAELYDALVSKSVGRGESFVLDDHGAVKGPFATLLRHPATGRPLQQMAAALRFSGLLPDQAREAVILVVAAYWREGHEWWSHEHIARAAGITDAQLASLHDGSPAMFDDALTQAAHDAAFAIVHRGDLTDEEYARVQSLLGDDQLVEVSLLVGYYGLLSMQLHVFRVPTQQPF